MKYLTSVAVLVFCLSMSCLFSATRADDLIYANDDYTGYVFAPGANSEVFDYGFSMGGKVSKFTFRYANTGSASRIIVRFYWNIDTRYYDPGWVLKQITLNNVPNTGGWYQDYTYVVPEAERFDLAGEFGYSFECSSSLIQLGLASGGLRNEDELWQYDPLWDAFGAFWFGGDPWAGIYMKVYKSPPIEVTTCDISGYKFDDADGDGVRDAGEPLMPGWDIYLDTNNNGTYETSEPNAVTDPNGMYIFKHLPAPATYRVREVMKDGWTQTLPGGADPGYVIAAEPNNVYTGRHFGNTRRQMIASISGMCFNDANANLQYDAGEPGLSGWTVYVDANKNGKLDGGESMAMTGAGGAYQLGGLPMGTHVIGLTMQSGWVGTFPTDACTHTVTLSVPDSTVGGIDFGNNEFISYGGGRGTESEPYLIKTGLHLQAIGAHEWDWNKHFKLMADISLAKYKGQEFNVIGRYNFVSELTPFSGTFDGNGFCISQFSYNYTDAPQEYIGLFGYVHGAGAAVRDVKLSDVNVNTQGGGVDTGALIGWLRSGTVSDCSVEGGSVQTDSFAAGGMVGSSDGTINHCYAGVDVASPDGGAGGLAGGNHDGVMTYCSAEGTVTGRYMVGGLVGSNGFQVHHCYAVADATGSQYVGGLVGENAGGDVRECYSQGVVRTVTDPVYGLEGTEAGGLVGRNGGGGAIFDCYSEAAVVGGKNIGGLVGLTWGTAEPCQIANSYSVGAVSGTSYLGGLIGSRISSDITGCFWNTQTSGRSSSAGGTGRTTTQMRNLATYELAGWDLVDETDNGSAEIWRICSGGDYPRLWWELEAGDLACPEGVGMEDLAYLAGRWLMEGTAAPWADINGDGIVNMSDFAVLPDMWFEEQ